MLSHLTDINHASHKKYNTVFSCAAIYNQRLVLGESIAGLWQKLSQNISSSYQLNHASVLCTFIELTCMTHLKYGKDLVYGFDILKRHGGRFDWQFWLTNIRLDWIVIIASPTKSAGWQLDSVAPINVCFLSFLMKTS